VIKDAYIQHLAVSSPGHPVAHRFCLLGTMGAGRMDLAGLGALEDLGRRLGGCERGELASPAVGMGSLGQDTG